MSDAEEVVIQEADAAPVDAVAPPPDSVPDATGVSTAPPAEIEPPLPTEVAGLRAAVSAERLEKKQARETAHALQQQVAELNAWVQQNAPYVQFVQANKHLFDPNAQRPAVAAPPSEPVVDPRDLEYAQTLDLWTPDGKPDVKRAAKFRALAMADAQTEAQRLVQPLHARNVQDQASIHYQQALQTVDANGNKPDPVTLLGVFQRMGPQMTSTADGAALAVIMANGIKVMGTKTAPAPPAGLPPFTEASGGQAPVKTALSQLEQRIATERGMTPQQWSERVGSYKPGQATVMED